MSRKSKKNTAVRATRDDSYVTNRRLRLREAVPTMQRQVFRYQPDLFTADVVDTRLSDVQDNRRYHPDGRFRPPMRVDASRASVRSDYTRLYQADASLLFQAPDQVLTCVRRKVREEVMHALKHAGKSGQKRPKRNFWSSVKCK